MQFYGVILQNSFSSSLLFLKSSLLEIIDDNLVLALIITTSDFTSKENRTVLVGTFLVPVLLHARTKIMHTSEFVSIKEDSFFAWIALALSTFADELNALLVDILSAHFESIIGLFLWENVDFQVKIFWLTFFRCISNQSLVFFFGKMSTFKSKLAFGSAFLLLAELATFGGVPAFI